MSKIGDVIVRLRLYYQDYEKGLKKAESKTKTWAGNFGKMMGVMKTGVLAVVGAAVAIGTELVKSSNKFGDAWARTMTGVKSAWQSFITQISNGNFRKAFSGISDSFQAGKEIADSRDKDFEFERSMRLRRAAIQNDLNDLNVTMTTSDDAKERIAAASKYISLIKELNEEEIKHWQGRANDELKYWLETAGEVATPANIAGARAYFNNPNGQGKFAEIWNQNKNDGLNGAVYDILDKEQEAMNELSDATVRAQKVIANASEALRKQNEEREQSLGLLREELPALEGIYDNSKLTAGMNEQIAGLDRLMEKYDEVGQKIHEHAEAIRDAGTSMYDSIVSGMVAGVEELGYAVAGLNDADAGTVVKALLSPLADAAVSAGVLIMTTGEALEAVKAAFTNWFGGGGIGAIAAGAALVAVGTAAKVGLAAIGSGKKSTNYASSSYGTSGEIGAMNSELTVYVKGTIKGSDILLSGQSTQNSWNR